MSWRARWEILQLRLAILITRLRLALREQLAADSFAGGGDLVDTESWFAGRDKIQHAAIGGLLWLLLWALGCDLGDRALWLLDLALAWEELELRRYNAWRARGGQGPWPFLADRFSWRDIVAAYGGALLIELLLQLQARLPSLLELLR